MYLSEMELQEVNKHAKTFGYIPEFNSIRYNYLKLQRMKSINTNKIIKNQNEKIFL